MYRLPAKFTPGRLLVVAMLVAIGASFVEPSTSVAQEQGGAKSAPAASGTPQSVQAAAAGDADKAPANPPQPSAAEKKAPTTQSSSVLGTLAAQYAISGDEVATLDRVNALIARTRAVVDGLQASLERTSKRTDAYKTSAKVLDEQLADKSLPKPARKGLARKSAVVQARVAVSWAVQAALQPPIKQRRALVDLLGERAENLRRAAQGQAAQASQHKERLQQAEAAEKAALEQAQRAKAREARERDEQVRSLIASRRAVLEQTAQVARDQSDQIQDAASRRAKRVETFASHREDIEAKLQGFVRQPSPEYAKKIVDPVFRQVLNHRDEVRQALLRHENQLETATDKMEKASAGITGAQAKLKEAQDGLTEIGRTAVGEQKVELARARLALRKRQLEAARDIAQARRKQLQLDQDQLNYYDRAIERLLPKISAPQRDRFYSVFDDINWQRAWFGVRQASERAFAILQKRVSQVLALPDHLTSVNLWGWVIGFLVRLLVLGAVIYVGQNYTDPVVRKLTSWALRRRFFQRRAALTIKGAEVLRSVIRPVVLYLVLNNLTAYLVHAFPELVFLTWGVDAFFLYWVIMTLVKVIVLPRRYREEAGTSPAPDLARLGADPTRASMSAVDVISIELTRARKLVRSVRIILMFWLLEHYVPQALEALLGHSVITWLVKTCFVWGLILVVYLVLTTWKDDIASIFERMAKDRLPRSVEFVKNHKDRIYGVLVIAVAFFYVAFREIGNFARSQASDTEWSKRVSNFVFRKRIELQHKEREGEHISAESLVAPLPQDYADFFEQSPLDDEHFKVQRDDQVTVVVEEVRSFLDGRPQGSLAMSAEQGMGKTSLLKDIGRALEREFPGVRRIQTELTSKVVGEQDVLAFVAELFDVGEVPATRVELVAILRDMDRRIVVIDDCHHFFVREIGGFSGLDTFLEVVNLTDDVHYWVLTFNKYAWNYINRVSPRKHYFGRVMEARAWTEREIQELIQRRNALTGRDISFTDLVITHDEGENDFYEIIKTANGYFRLLHEFSGGNPMVALEFWKRSVKSDGDGIIQVSLFSKPSMRPVQQLSDEYLFALAAIAQHGALGAGELAEIINSERAFCEMALNYFEERDIVELDASGKRAHISPLYFRQVVKQLAASNFLWD